MGDGNADKYFRPFQLACENPNAKIRATALDCIQKLVGKARQRAAEESGLLGLTCRAVFVCAAYGYLRGNSRVLQNGRKRYLIDIVVETICSCRDDPGENVQLQVIKALLTMVSSNTCEVHGESLLLSVRACYHIYLVSKNQVNRTTAKATLTQMLNIVFQRVEVFDQRLGVEGAGDGSVSGVTSPSASPGLDRLTAMPPMGQDLDDHSGTASAPASEPPVVQQEAVAAASDVTSSEDAGAADGAAAAASADGGPSAASLTVDAGDGSAGDAAPLSPPSGSAPGTEPGEGEGYGGTPTTASGFRSPLHRDAFLLFRALCKLSMKGEDEAEEASAATMSDTIALQSKLLSLELLLSILEHSGPSFKSGTRFIEVIRQVRAVVLLCLKLVFLGQHSPVELIASERFPAFLSWTLLQVLCESLLKNYVSPSSQVVSLSLKIFLAIIRNFRVSVAQCCLLSAPRL